MRGFIKWFCFETVLLCIPDWPLTLSPSSSAFQPSKCWDYKYVPPCAFSAETQLLYYDVAWRTCEVDLYMGLMVQGFMKSWSCGAELADLLPEAEVGLGPLMAEDDRRHVFWTITKTGQTWGGWPIFLLTKRNLFSYTSQTWVRVLDHVTWKIFF